MVKKVFTRHPIPSPVESIDSDVNPIDEDLPEGGNKVVTIVFILLVLLGVGTGYMLSKKFNAPIANGTGAVVTSTANGKKSAGVEDTKTFTDSATGTIQSGGSGGEGTHNLVRDGGPSQTVYLISSVVDLDQFIGKKVTVWGQTMAAKKVPWLMDVGRVDSE